MESDTSNQLTECDFNRLERIPNELIIGELIKETSVDYSKLAYYEGKIIIDNEERNYLIREFTSRADEVRSKAHDELILIGYLRDKIKIVDVYGYIIEYLSEDKMKYTLITQAYAISFDNVQRNEQGLANLLYKLVLTLEIATKNYIFHGGLSPKFIYIDENNEVLLGNFFWSYFYNHKISREDYIKLLKFQDDSFLSPETLLLKNCKNLKIEKIDYVGADVYSVGLIGLHLLESYRPYNQLVGAPQSIIDSIYSKKRKGEKPLKIPLEIDIVNVDCTDLQEAFSDCLRNVLSYRINYQQLLTRLGYVIQAPEIQTTEDVSIIANSKEFDNLLIAFENYMNNFHLRKDKTFFTLNYIRAMKLCYLSEHSEYLEATYSRYLLTKYRTEVINVADGIGYFIRELYIDLNCEDLAAKFKEMITDSGKHRSYASIFEQLLSLNTALQDYVITGLCVQSYSRDWDYFFPENEDIPYKEYAKLVDITHLYQEFRAIIVNPVVKNILITYLPIIDQEFERTIESLALERTFIIKMQPSLYGLTTYNGNIFLSSFQRQLSNINQNSPAEIKVAILLKLLHELAHLLRRSNCQSFKDSKNRFTPKNNAGFMTHKEERKTENALTESRGESGEQLEILLLGENYSHINREAALYFLEGNFSKENFKEEFKIKNESKINYIFMAKSKTEQQMGGLKCRVSMKIK